MSTYHVAIINPKNFEKCQELAKKQFGNLIGSLGNNNKGEVSWEPSVKYRGDKDIVERMSVAIGNFIEGVNAAL